MISNYQELNIMVLRIIFPVVSHNPSTVLQFAMWKRLFCALGKTLTSFFLVFSFTFLFEDFYYSLKEYIGKSVFVAVQDSCTYAWTKLCLNEHYLCETFCLGWTIHQCNTTPMWGLISLHLLIEHLPQRAWMPTYGTAMKDFRHQTAVYLESMLWHEFTAPCHVGVTSKTMCKRLTAGLAGLTTNGQPAMILLPCDFNLLVYSQSCFNVSQSSYIRFREMFIKELQLQFQLQCNREVIRGTLDSPSVFAPREGYIWHDTRGLPLKEGFNAVINQTLY